MERKHIIWTAIGVAVLLILIVLLNTFVSVPTGTVGVKVRFGKVREDVITEGLNIKMPFVENIVIINCKTKKIEVTTEAASKDLQTVQMAIAVNYNVKKDTANTLYREIGENYESVILQPAILESIKTVVAQYNAEEVITKRSEISAGIHNMLISKVENRGITITEFNVTDIDFSDAFNAAIEAKAVKQQEVETAKAELEKAKQENQRKIENAEADAKIMALQNQQITDKTLQLKALEIQEKMLERWNGSFPSTILSDNLSTLFSIGGK